MSEAAPISAEVRELLGALAADGQAGLLRARTRPRQTTAVVTSSAPFLKAAERKLLDAHREEVARLLYGLASALVKGRGDGPRLVHFREEAVHLDRGQLAGRLGRIAAAGIDLDDHGALDLVRACSLPGTALDAQHLIATAFRLAPSDSLRVLRGLSTFLDEGDATAARGQLNELLSSKPSGRIASYAWENLGMMAIEMGRFDEAARSYEMAATCDRERIIPRVSWLNASLLSEDLDQAIRAAGTLEAALESTAAVGWLVGCRNQSKRPIPGHRARELARQMMDRSGPVARKVCDAFR